MKLSLIKFLISILIIFISINSCVEDHVMPKLGNVFITSDPSGAKIFIDDEEQSKVTPDSLNNLLEGEYKITLKLNDFKDTTFNINVTDNSNVTEDIYLFESNPKGKIILNSNPSGAQIFVNGKNTGNTTPDTLINLQRGTYSVSLKLDLYDDFNLIIPLGKDETVSKNIKMAIAGTSGTLIVTSDPSGAAISLNGENTGKTTPDTLKPLQTGFYNIKLTLSDFRDTTITTNIASGVIVNKDVYLTESNPKGKISITSTPSGAQIYLNGITTSKVTPNNFDNLPRGNYEVTLKKALYDDAVFQISLAKDQTVNKSMVMNIASTSSTLIITSQPSGAAVSLDGNITFKVTPDTIKPLQSGNHIVGLSLSGYRDTSVTVLVNSGQIKTTNVNLTVYEPRGSISLTSNPSGASIYLDGVNTGFRTPNKLTKLEAGQYDITLKLLGYYDSTFSVNVNADLNSTIPIVNLRPLPAIGDFKINSDPAGAEIYIGGINSGLLTPQTFEKLLVQEIIVTLKLEDFADTTITFDLVKDNLVDLGTVYLRDNVPPVDVILDYLINANEQLVISFVFNQDIKLEKVNITFPNGSLQTQNYNNQLIPKERKIDWVYPEKITGDWIFKFYGNKVGGRQVEFEFSEQISVQ
ncbi:MAG: PEGA domain-containing protein [Ignavibacteriae bacterium]|nr:PEGA domain-containing protein [Ignavibacteriota bacterium]